MEVNSVNAANPVEAPLQTNDNQRVNTTEAPEETTPQTTEAFEVEISEEALAAQRAEETTETTEEAEPSTEPEVVQVYNNAGQIAG